MEIFKISALITCKPGSEEKLAAEMSVRGPWEGNVGHERVMMREPLVNPSCFESCYGVLALFNPVKIPTENTGTCTRALIDTFATGARDVRFDASWICHFSGNETSGGGPGAIERRFREGLRKVMSRVERLAQNTMPVPNQRTRGWFAWVDGTDRAVYASAEGWYGGQGRMRDDSLAPSRSYLKVEEAYRILGSEPTENQTVIDLGAAPGGWSYSAAKRGARVVALDNGPLKAGAADHALICHRREDAFSFVPVETADWLFCDMVEEPNRIIELVKQYVSHKWCRSLVVNLKTGRTDPVQTVAMARRVLTPYCATLYIRELYHDRDEITIVGHVNP